MRYIVLASTLLALAACGGETHETDQGHMADQAHMAQPAGMTAAASGPQTPDADGKIIVVEMITDGTGNYYRPARIEAHPGDVIRFTLVSGVHNVNFVPDSNPKGVTLPKVSDMLQLPGQTYDVKVALPPGEYYFHCDPHALLGMIGRLEVEKDDD